MHGLWPEPNQNVMLAGWLCPSPLSIRPKYCNSGACPMPYLFRQNNDVAELHISFYFSGHRVNWSRPICISLIMRILSIALYVLMQHVAYDATYNMHSQLEPSQFYTLPHATVRQEKPCGCVIECIFPIFEQQCKTVPCSNPMRPGGGLKAARSSHA